MDHGRAGERGLATLLVTVITAFVFSLAAFAVLLMGLSRAQQNSPIDPNRLRARYAAEAGLVWAMAKLWDDPGWGPGKTWTIVDTDGDGKLVLPNDTKVDIILAGCLFAPCEDRKLQAMVTY
jgi:hypothetical protein